MNTADVQKLIDDGRAIEKQQAQVQAVLAEKEKELAEVELQIRTDFKCEPDELPAKIEETKAEIMRLAAEGGLIEGAPEPVAAEEPVKEPEPEEAEESKATREQDADALFTEPDETFGDLFADV